MTNTCRMYCIACSLYVRKAALPACDIETTTFENILERTEDNSHSSQGITCFIISCSTDHLLSFPPPPGSLQQLVDIFADCIPPGVYSLFDLPLYGVSPMAADLKKKRKQRGYKSWLEMSSCKDIFIIYRYRFNTLHPCFCIEEYKWVYLVVSAPFVHEEMYPHPRLPANQVKSTPKVHVHIVEQFYLSGLMRAPISLWRVVHFPTDISGVVSLRYCLKCRCLLSGCEFWAD